jgi:apolipoprotein N-acyltransferase
VTNDGWFGSSTGPYQHFDMARVRAIEYGIPLARVANTGISAFIDPLGRIEKKLNLNEKGIIDVALTKKIDETIYSRYDHIPLGLIVFLLMTILMKKDDKKTT